MSIANRPSKITLPTQNKGWDNLLEFVTEQFPLIDKGIWIARFNAGKIHWLSGEIVNANSAFVANQTLCYYREVKQEPEIPFEHRILFQNEHILVADKPHYLPVTPGGQYVNECLLERLRKQTHLKDLVPLHRLDRETAGLVLFSVNKDSRGTYAQLFAEQKISKTYQAVADISQTTLVETNWTVNNRLEKGQPTFIMQQVDGAPNACSEIRLIDRAGQLGFFELNPLTGKTHQLRLHMMDIGYPILNDKFYPELEPKQPLSFDNPLQLLAKKLSFTDPISAEPLQFTSEQDLSTWNLN